MRATIEPTTGDGGLVPAISGGTGCGAGDVRSPRKRGYLERGRDADYRRTRRWHRDTASDHAAGNDPLYPPPQFERLSGREREA